MCSCWTTSHQARFARRSPWSRAAPKVEVSGKIVLDNARAYALAGVDYISVSQLTQSVKAFDFSFRVSR